MTAVSTSTRRRTAADLPQPAPSTVRLYVVVPARVKAWLELEAEREGLAVSAVVRQRLTRAMRESTVAS